MLQDVVYCQLLQRNKIKECEDGYLISEIVELPGCHTQAIQEGKELRQKEVVYFSSIRTEEQLLSQIIQEKNLIEDF